MAMNSLTCKTAAGVEFTAALSFPVTALILPFTENEYYSWDCQTHTPSHTCVIYDQTHTYIHATDKCELFPHLSLMTLNLSLYCSYKTLALMFSDDGTKVKCQWWSLPQSND